MIDDAEEARALLVKAADLRAKGLRAEARDLVAAAHVHALLVQSIVVTTAFTAPGIQTPAWPPPTVRSTILDLSVIPLGEVVDVHTATERVRARGFDASPTIVSNELGRSVREGRFVRLRRGVYQRNGEADHLPDGASASAGRTA